jgi:hypothetical protein
MVIWDSNDIAECDRRRPGLSDTPLNVVYDNNSIEQKPSI